MSSLVSGAAALIAGALLGLVAILGGTAALTPSVQANNTPVVNYDAR
jgi:hypothetical protein